MSSLFICEISEYKIYTHILHTKSFLSVRAIFSYNFCCSTTHTTEKARQNRSLFAILGHVKMSSLFICEISKYTIYTYVLHIKRFLSVRAIFSHNFCCSTTHTTENTGQKMSFVAIFADIKMSSLFICQIRKYSIYRHVLYIKSFFSVRAIFSYNFCCSTTHTTEKARQNRSHFAILGDVKMSSLFICEISKYTIYTYVLHIKRFLSVRAIFSHNFCCSTTHTTENTGQNMSFVAIFADIKMSSLFICQIRKYSICRHVLYIKSFFSVRAIFSYNFCCSTTHTTENARQNRSLFAILGDVKMSSLFIL